MNIRISPLSLGRGLFFGPRKVIGCAIAAVVMIVLVVLGIGASIFFGWQRHQHLAKLTAEAPAQVLEVKVTTLKRNYNTNAPPDYSTRITYKFDANGRTIETEWTKSGDVSDEYEVGKRAKVCYDPSNPNDNEIFTLSYRCGQ